MGWDWVLKNWGAAIRMPIGVAKELSAGWDKLGQQRLSW